MAASIWREICVFVRRLFFLTKLVLRLTFVNILVLIPSCRRKFVKETGRKLNIPGEDFINSSLGWNTWRMIREIAKNCKYVVEQRAKQGSMAPNARVILLDDNSECKLLDFMQAGRPLVVNFGSASWPPFYRDLTRTFREIKETFSDVADFCIVYIQEAHAMDGWNLVYKVCKTFLFLVRLHSISTSLLGIPSDLDIEHRSPLGYLGKSKISLSVYVLVWFWTWQWFCNWVYTI